MNPILERVKQLVAYLTSNMISLTGVIIATLTGMVTPIFIAALQLELFKSHYVGIMTYLMLPTVFILALLLIPAGIIYDKHMKLKEKHLMPVLDLNNPVHRFRFFFIALLTIINIVIIAVAFMVGVNFMNTVPFCGEVCHTVMQPEFASYKESPHSRVKCVECHIGGGATWFVKSKLSGIKQVFAVAFNTYPRPIPSPIQDLRPARDTCEQCHWPEKFLGEKRIVKTKYDSDQFNTPIYTVLVLKIGGKRIEDDKHVGIHWHVGKFFSIKYKALDKKKNKIGWVQLTSSKGTTTFTSDEYNKFKDRDKLESKEMDCVDCHNRPTHRFFSPELTVDRSISQNTIARTLPWIKRESVRILTEKYGDKDVAVEIPKKLIEFYQTNYPGQVKEWGKKIKQSAAELVRIHKVNVFPKMNLSWGTHWNNIGHMESNAPGCFRCHTDELKTKDGKQIINNDCSLCHDLLVEDERDLGRVKRVLSTGIY